LLAPWEVCPLALGYQFTEIGVIAEWNRNIRARNDVAGDFVNVRFVVRF
jgi:hypothetical protein